VNNYNSDYSNSSDIHPFTPLIKITAMLLLSLSLVACASSPDAGSAGEGAPVSDASTSAATGETPAADATPATADAASGGDSAASTSEAASATPAVVPEETKPPKMVESCKDEPYGKYEQQSRESIAKGLEATKAEVFGVGFRNVAEHNKWSKIHNSLFKSVNDACTELAECGKKHKKDKDTECVTQAKTFATWQNLAKSFAEKAKTVEKTEPPIICSLEPSLDDPANCFHELGANIVKACDTDDCKDLADCWRGVGFLDAAIIQSTQSCGFVHQKLETCRGYIEAKMRRENKFKQCGEMQGQIKLTVFPVL